jgi:CHAD domain-containing protein
MREYVFHQTDVLIRRVAVQVSQAVQQADEESIHHLRVSIRRLSACLKTFSSFYSGRSWKKIRRKLKELMQAAGDVRDHDIAAKLMLQAGMEPGSAAFASLKKERDAAAGYLATVLSHWKHSSFSHKWREDLGL